MWHVPEPSSSSSHGQGTAPTTAAAAHAAPTNFTPRRPVGVGFVFMSGSLRAHRGIYWIASVSSLTCQILRAGHKSWLNRARTDAALSLASTSSAIRCASAVSTARTASFVAGIAGGVTDNASTPIPSSSARPARRPRIRRTPIPTPGRQPPDRSPESVAADRDRTCRRSTRPHRCCGRPPARTASDRWCRWTRSRRGGRMQRP